MSYPTTTFTRPGFLPISSFGIRSLWPNNGVEWCAQLLIRRPMYRQGVSGTLDSASNSTMDNEFKAHVLEDVIKRILEEGQLHEIEVSFSPARLLPFQIMPLEPQLMA